MSVRLKLTITTALLGGLLILVALGSGNLLSGLALRGIDHLTARYRFRFPIALRSLLVRKDDDDPESG